MAIFIDWAPSSRHARQSLDLACSICFLFSVNLVLRTESRTSHIWVSTLALSCIPGPVIVLLKYFFYWSQIHITDVNHFNVNNPPPVNIFTVLYNFGLTFQDLFSTPEGSLLLLSSYSCKPWYQSQFPHPPLCHYLWNKHGHLLCSRFLSSGLGELLPEVPSAFLTSLAPSFSVSGYYI